MERLRRPLRWEGEAKLSALLRLLQDFAGEDADRRGCGRAELVKQGCVWVLVKYRLTIGRLPRPDEALTLTTWPICGRLGLYPRSFELLDAAGEPLLRAESLWAMMDLHSRGMISGEERGILVLGAEEERFRPPHRIAVPEGGEVFAFTPSPDQIDVNGHMNNAAYLDAVEPVLPAAFRGRTPRALAVDYEHELLPGQQAALRVVTDGESCFFEGNANDKVCFRLREDF